MTLPRERPLIGEQKFGRANRAARQLQVLGARRLRSPFQLQSDFGGAGANRLHYFSQGCFGNAELASPRFRFSKVIDVDLGAIR